MLTDRIFAIAVAGPTAGGKTGLAISLAEALEGEIISADSMQIYRELRLGTAKPTSEEKRRARHHLIDIKSLTEPYSAADFARDALAAAREIASRGHLPIICGGTGLYLEALRTSRHEDAPDTRDEAYRSELLSRAECDGGKEALWQELSAVDPVSAAATHKNNLRRVIRALEIYRATGVPKSEWDARASLASPDIEILPFLLDYRSRELLYRRIDRRVDRMVAEGLIEEARLLYTSGALLPHTTAGQAIGYKEFIPYFEGRLNTGEAIEALKLASRRYAKRQLTWFRRRSGMIPVYADTPSGDMRAVEDLRDEVMDILARTPRTL